MSARKPLDTSKYDADNLAQARRVLEQPEQHGAGMVEWARMAVERIEGMKSEELRPEGQNNESAHS